MADPNDPGKYLVARAGDVAVVAHRHPDGYWLWAADPAFTV